VVRGRLFAKWGWEGAHARDRRDPRHVANCVAMFNVLYMYSNAQPPRMVHQRFGIPMGSEFLKYLQNYSSVPLQNFHVYSIDYYINDKYPENFGAVRELIVILTFWFVTLCRHHSTALCGVSTTQAQGRDMHSRLLFHS
jgi:hypothetical protein